MPEDNREPSTLRLVGIQIAGGIMAGFIAVGGVLIAWGSIQTKMERAIEDIRVLTTTVYTQREAFLELRPIRIQIERLATKLDDYERRIIRLEGESLRGTPPWATHKDPEDQE